HPKTARPARSNTGKTTQFLLMAVLHLRPRSSLISRVGNVQAGALRAAMQAVGPTRALHRADRARCAFAARSAVCAAVDPCRPGGSADSVCCRRAPLEASAHGGDPALHPARAAGSPRARSAGVAQKGGG